MRLATPGAILMFAGILILWWGLGIVRGEVNGGGNVKRIVGSMPKVGTPGQSSRSGRSGGADARLQ